VRGYVNSRSEDETVDDQVFPRSSVEQLSTEDKEGVEPSSSLIDTFSNKVGGVRLVDSVDILKGIVGLGIGHTVHQL
jgi:hypothetical protein